MEFSVYFSLPFIYLFCNPIPRWMNIEQSEENIGNHFNILCTECVISRCVDVIHVTQPIAMFDRPSSSLLAAASQKPILCHDPSISRVPLSEHVEDGEGGTPSLYMTSIHTALRRRARAIARGHLESGSSQDCQCLNRNQSLYNLHRI